MILSERIKAIEQLQKDFEVPWQIKRFGIEPTLAGDQIFFVTEASSDCATLEEAKAVAEWLVEQLGGKIKWQKDRK